MSAQMIGSIAVVVGALITVIAVLSFGLAIFQRMRTRDFIKLLFAFPFVAMTGAIIAVVGYIYAGYGDIPAGYENWLLRGLFGVFCVGLVLGGVLRAKGLTSPAIEATASVVMKACPRCAEKVQGAAKVCRFCGHEFAIG